MSPLYSQSNGLAERAVRSVKSVLEKCRRDGSDIYMALLNLRNTPRDSKLKSPAQRLMSRHLRSIVPTGKKLLQPQIQNIKEVESTTCSST